jgi:hypothetical protein
MRDSGRNDASITQDASRAIFEECMFSISYTTEFCKPLVARVHIVSSTNMVSRHSHM